MLRFFSAALLTAAMLPAQISSGWRLVWSDEFNGSAHTPPDPTKWNYDLGGGGWGNGEQEVYTNSVDNAFQDGQGHLVIRAIKDASGNYTSARLRTGRTNAAETVDLSWQYGKVEARMKLPYGPGIWPAFWMLGSNITAVSWPACGEMDILENFGSHIDDASTVHATIHGPNFAGAGVGAADHLPRQQKFTDDYHLFSVEWAQDSVRFFVDGTSYESLTPSSVPSGGTWVFNHPFFLILNLAIGGNYVQNPDAGTPFPQDLLVDYVRVYQSVSLPNGTPAIAPGGVVNAASGLGTVAPGALASIYGSNLADATYSSLFQNGVFATSTPSGVNVIVNGTSAPLTYVSPTQINFQLPWATALAPENVTVSVKWNGATSDAEAVTVTPTSPAFFLDPVTGTALITVANGVGVLYGNGFGPTGSPQQDGAPATGAAPTGSSCSLSVSGKPAIVNYCGAAPGEIIDQLNFVYPLGSSPGSNPLLATLTIDGIAGTFLLPAN